MNEKPILFSGPMVKAILDGRKVMTRRIVKPPSPRLEVYAYREGESYPYYIRRKNCLWYSYKTIEQLVKKHCPYGTVGDRLWVRETYLPDPPQDGTWPYYDYTDGVLHNLDAIPIEYRNPSHVIYKASWPKPDELRWRPSIFMPRWASRITLEITGVRVERLQDINAKDAVAEGIELARWALPESQWPLVDYGKEYDGRVLVGKFKELWQSINGAESWNQNPWVWVMSFKRVENEANRKAA